MTTKDNNEAANIGAAVAEGVDTAELRLLLNAVWYDHLAGALRSPTYQKVIDFITTYGAQQREAGRRERDAESAKEQVLQYKKGYSQGCEEGAALSRQPAGEGLTDERAAFEHAERASDLSRTDDTYDNPCVQSAWEGWQARAILSAPVAAVPQGEEDLSISVSVEPHGTLVQVFDGGKPIYKEFHEMLAAVPPSKAEGMSDTERLDFITTFGEPWMVQWEKRGAKPIRYRMIHDAEPWGKWHTSARDAIDAAILAQQAKGEKK